MTTQRERLAATLFNVKSDDNGEALAEIRASRDGYDPLIYAEEWYIEPLKFADALLARGVRVIDAETFGRALHAIFCSGLLPMHSSPNHSAEHLIQILDNIDK